MFFFWMKDKKKKDVFGKFKKEKSWEKKKKNSSPFVESV